MSTLLRKIIAVTTILSATAVSFAQDSEARPAVAFPPTPTPAPPAQPMTQAEMDEFLIPSQFLSRTSSVLCIVHNGFRRSQIDPCGCVTNQLGGLDKEARLIKRIEEHNIPSIQVDAGGFVRDMANEGLIEQSKGILRGLGQIGYEAVNVGFTDLALTPDELKSLAQESNISLVSANITDEAGTAVFEPYVIKEVTMADGTPLKIGIVGITRPRVEMATGSLDEPTSITAGQGNGAVALKISDPVKALNKYTAELADQADFVIALAYDRRNNAERIINGLADKASIDVLVTGENSQLQGSVQMLHGVQVVSGGYEGRQVGTLYVELKDNNVATTWNRHIDVLQTIAPVAEVTAIMEATHAEVDEVQPAQPEPTKLEL